MNISGSAAWFAKADLGITVHRGDEGVEIHCWKSRFKWVGQQGVAVLDYDLSTGRYSEKVKQTSSVNYARATGRDWDDLDDF